MIKKSLLIYILLITTILLNNCCKFPQEITLSRDALYPEGIEYDTRKEEFLLSSLKYGTISRVDLKGNLKDFIQDENLISTIGIRADQKNNKLYICNSDPGVSIKTSPETQRKIAGLAVYDLGDGTKLNYYELHKLFSGNHFCNDIALDEKGSVYVTDSFAPAIYKIDLSGKATLFLTDKRFEGEGFNLNGIIATREYLIVAKSNEGILFKIPLEEPQKMSIVNISEKFPGADGLVLNDQNTLTVITNGAKTVYKLKSSDNFESAEIVEKNSNNFKFPTTGVKVYQSVYLINAELDKLFKNETPVNNYVIEKVNFKKSN